MIAKFGRRSTGFLRRIAGGMDSNCNHSQCSCSYREFFQQDEYGFEETGADQMIDPGFVDVGVILVLNLGISESV